MWVFGDRLIRVVQGGLPGMTTYHLKIVGVHIANAHFSMVKLCKSHMDYGTGAGVVLSSIYEHRSAV